MDELVPRSKFRETVEERAQEIAARTQEKKELQGIPLTAIDPQIDPDQIRYNHLLLKLDRKKGCVDFHIQGPNEKLPESIEELHQKGDQNWLLALGRELDDAILHLSFNDPELGTWVFHTEGNLSNVVVYEQFLIDQSNDWLARDCLLYTSPSPRDGLLSRMPSSA